jgi:hypothetical protein
MHETACNNRIQNEMQEIIDPSSPGLAPSILCLLNAAGKESFPRTPKYSIRNLSRVPAIIKLREDRNENMRAPLSLSLKTKKGVLRFVSEQQQAEGHFTDSELDSTNLPHKPYIIDGSNAFHFGLNPSITSKTTNKTYLMKSLESLRTFKVSLAPRKRIQLLDKHLAEQQPKGSQAHKHGIGPTFNSEEYVELCPQTQPYKAGVPKTRQSYSKPTKEPVIKHDAKKAIALSLASSSKDTEISKQGNELTEEHTQLHFHGKDTRSYDDTNLNPLYSSIKERPSKPLNNPPLVDFAIVDVAGGMRFTDSFAEDSLASMDSYHEERREKFLQHNIRSADEEEEEEVGERGGERGEEGTSKMGRSASLSVSESSFGSRASAADELVVQRRAKKYAPDAEALAQRQALVHTASSLPATKHLKL